MNVMDAISLVQFVFEAGNELIERCEAVRQCHSEATRIALRTVRTLGALEGASSEFSQSVPFSASLNELKGTMEQAAKLVKRCHRPMGVVDSIRAIARVNANKAGLLEVESELERITRDLQIPMLADIRRAIQQVQARENGDRIDEGALQQAVRAAIREELDARGTQGQGTVRELIEGRISSSQENGSDAVQQGRVSFDMLVEEEEILGEGTFGVVYAGEYMGKAVALKKARGIIGDASVLRAFRREAETHFAMRHENIVRVLAFDEGSPERPPCMIMERMEESLSSFLEVMTSPPSLVERLETIKDVSKGLSFLHQHRITHRDVKSSNVLFDQAGTAKLSDFGLAIVEASVAKSTFSYTAPHNSKVGSEQYMAPEVHVRAKATYASDVFSFHVLMWEVLTHQTVGVGPPIGEQLRRSSDSRLLIGSSVPAPHHKRVQDVLSSCGHLDPKMRPGMESVLLSVNDLLDSLGGRPSYAATTETVVPVPVSGPTFNDPGSDRAALLSLFDATNVVPKKRFFRSTKNAGWRSKKGWGSSRPLGEWDGVTMSAERRVVALVLRGNNLKGSIRPEVGGLVAVVSLDLSNNQLRDTIPQTLGGLTAMQTLDLRKNNLSGPIPSALGGLTSLKVLNLSGNQLNDLIPTALSGMSSMETLDLGNNLLSGPVPPALGKLAALLTLNLSGNQLSGTIPPALGRCTALQTLGLGENKLNGPTPHALSEMMALTSLDVDNNRPSFGAALALDASTDRLTLRQIFEANRGQSWPQKTGWGTASPLGGWFGVEEDNAGRVNELRICGRHATHFAGHREFRQFLEGAIPKEVVRLTALKSLGLTDNDLTGAIPMELGRLTTLHELYLYGNRLTGNIPIELGKLIHLRTLSLWGNQLTGTIPTELGRLTNLRRLILNRNQLTGTIPTELGRLTNLADLYIEDNQLTGTIPQSLREILEQNKNKYTTAIFSS